MSRNPPAVTLHQQDGGITAQAFADREGLTLKQVLTAARRGQLLGARQNPLSNRWWVYPPARLLHRPKSRCKPVACQTVGKPPEVAQATPNEGGSFPRSAPGCLAVVDVGTSPHGLSADLPLPVQETPEASSLPLSAKPVLPFGGTQPPAVDLPLPVSGTSAAVFLPADAGSTARSVYRSPEVRRVCQVLREAAARQHREGIHYLRLDGCEFSRLYAALDHERSRIRKLVGKGLAAVGELRATDSVWQKMQAMCQEGRLL